MNDNQSKVTPEQPDPYSKYGSERRYVVFKGTDKDDNWHEMVFLTSGIKKGHVFKTLVDMHREPNKDLMAIWEFMCEQSLAPEFSLDVWRAVVEDNPGAPAMVAQELEEKMGSGVQIVKNP